MTEFAIKTFLSHRYKSPNVNLYFHELISEIAEIQFEVDEGFTSINVTRLERMIRESDAFIGIYPFPESPEKQENPPDPYDASKYFRLELDLAIRSDRPTMVFFDKRYSQVFTFPKSIRAEPFDNQEVTSKGGSPKRYRFLRIIEDFIKEVKEYKDRIKTKPVNIQPFSIGLILPTTGSEKFKYNDNDIEVIKNMLEEHRYKKVKHLPWPPVLNGEYYAEIEELDWVIIDIGETTMRSGIVGYLHGRFIPMLRLLKGFNSIDQIKNQDCFQGLYGGLEVGYQEDIVAWETMKSLKSNIEKRLTTIKAIPKRISTKSEAEDYFSKAAKRKEAVFLSYSGKDVIFASKLSLELRERFQEVFDYKDGESIIPGVPWLKGIFEKLSTSALGILLVSKNYLASGNCKHEAREIVAKSDMNTIAMIPIQLYKEALEYPSWMRDRQYLFAYDYKDVKVMTERIVNFFDRAAQELSV